MPSPLFGVDQPLVTFIVYVRISVYTIILSSAISVFHPQDEILQQQSSMSDITVSSEPGIITEVVTTSEMIPVSVINDFPISGDQVN